MGVPCLFSCMVSLWRFQYFFFFKHPKYSTRGCKRMCFAAHSHCTVGMGSMPSPKWSLMMKNDHVLPCQIQLSHCPKIRSDPRDNSRSHILTKPYHPKSPKVFSELQLDLAVPDQTIDCNVNILFCVCGLTPYPHVQTALTCWWGHFKGSIAYTYNP